MHRPLTEPPIPAAMCVQESFLTEWSRLAQLRHPHIITMLGMAVTKGQGMLLMELAEGKCHSVSMSQRTQGGVRAAGEGCVWGCSATAGASTGPEGVKAGPALQPTASDLFAQCACMSRSLTRGHAKAASDSDRHLPCISWLSRLCPAGPHRCRLTPLLLWAP